MKQQKSPYVGLSFLCCLLFSPLTFAAPPTTLFSGYFNHSYWHPIITLTGGPVIHSDTGGQSQNFPARNGIFSFYNYAANNVNQTPFVAGGSIGAEFLLYPQWSLQAGLGYYQPSVFHVEGVVTQGVDTESANQYSYQYNIQSRQLLVESKLLYHWRLCYPYLYAGLGSARNNSQNFSVNIEPPFTTISNQFQSNTKTSFTYSVGFGVDFTLGEQGRLGLGYRFTDLGASKTGNGIINTVSTMNTLSQSHLYANEIFAQFTAIIL